MKITTLVISSALGALMGNTTAWWSWQAIYGIGSRVIEDQEHYELERPVLVGGTIVGVAIGAMLAYLARKPILTQLGIYGISIALFTLYIMCDSGLGPLTLQSWQMGLLVQGTIIVLATIVIVQRCRASELEGQQ